MANNVLNIIEFEGNEEEINKVMKTIIKDDGFDFNSIIPMPTSLLCESGSRTGLAINYVLKKFSEYTTVKSGYADISSIRINGLQKDEDLEKRRRSHGYKNEKSLIEDGIQYISNIVKYGYPTWYEWSIKNWGTKWNAYNRGVHDNIIDFETAWCAPHCLIVKMSEMFPEIIIHHKWADENLGENCGYIVYKNGVILEEGQDPEYGYEFAKELWGE